MATITGTYFSNIIGCEMNFSMLYPFEAKEKPKLLYFLHGAGDNHTTILRKTTIETSVECQNLAIVFPQGHRSYYTNMAYGRNYYDAMMQELFPYIEKTFRVSTKREDMFIGGLSMGGYGAMKLAFKNPNKFSKCFALSPVTDINHMKNELIAEDRKGEFKAIFGDSKKVSKENDLYDMIKTLQSNTIQLYRSCGTEDFLFQDNNQFTHLLDTHHIAHQYHVREGGHDWQFWNSEIRNIIPFLTGDINYEC